ncbi:MAG TPA: hypothetical protein VG370_21950 [Chloroflexota bacterium]|jgi:hypothetical protein|nr:hypothetical protein [Chloroflexota bacterium]
MPLEVELFGGEPDPETGLLRYDPGATVRGLVRVGPDGPPARGVRAVARWRASGRAGTDEGGGSDVIVHGADVGPGSRLELPFEYRLPREPWSYQGELFAIDWRLEARLDVPLGRDPAAAASFILAPRPAKQGPYPGAATAKQEDR